MKYFDGFEIIDGGFANILNKTFSNITIPIVNFVIINDKIFLYINYEQKNFYQIMSLNENNILNFGYLIEIEKNMVWKDINSLNYFIFDALQRNGIEYLFSQGNPISFDNNNIIFNLYSKNSNFKRKIIQKNVYNNDSFDQSTKMLSNEPSFSSLKTTQKKNVINIIFETTAQYKVDIEIEYEKTMEELIKLYFKKINRLDLYGDKNIVFLYSGKVIKHNSKDIIRNYFEKKKSHYGNKIIINDILNKLPHVLLNDY